MSKRKYRMVWSPNWQAWSYRPLWGVPPVHIIAFMAELNRLNSEVTREGR